MSHELPPDLPLQTSLESNPKEITLPQQEAITEAFEKQYAKDPEAAAHMGELKENIEKILDAFLEEEMKNVAVYRSEKSGVAFPHTSISLTQLVRRLSEGTTDTRMSSADGPSEKKRGQEFVFTSAVFEPDGNEFDFVEIAIHEMVRQLPRALAELREGREPEDFEVTTLGYPSNPLGLMSEEFLQEMKKKPIQAMAELYSEFVAQKLSKADTTSDVELYGISMGSGMAALTGEKLMEQGAVTQKSEEGLPRLNIRAELPVSMGPSMMKKIQIPVGFLANGAVMATRDPYVKSVGPKRIDFLSQVNSVFAERGIPVNMSKEQEAMKKQARISLVTGLGNDISLKPETKVNEVYGMQDPTTWTPGLRSDRKRHEAEHEGSLGEAFLSRPEDRQNVRRFGVDMPHLQPFIRPNELQRWKAAAEALNKEK